MSRVQSQIQTQGSTDAQAPDRVSLATTARPLQPGRFHVAHAQIATGLARRGPTLAFFLNGAATLHLVWFYLTLVRCYINLGDYETGTASTPYQHRLLLMVPLRWAHASVLCQSMAAGLTSMRAWFPFGVRAENIVEFPIDVASVVLAGLVTHKIYKAASPTGLLTPLVYPLTLLMVAGTYALGTMHRLRFIYDLPSLGLFAGCLYLLYFRRSYWNFALLFIVATLNRETTLFLLALFVLTRCLDTRASHSRGCQMIRLPWKDGAFALALLALWVLWHVWVTHRFAANPTESWSRVRLNLWILAVPASWLQLLSCFGFCGPVLFAYRRLLLDQTLRLWLWIFPVWAIFMLHYGLFLETRIFGELIPVVACCIALITERALLQRLNAAQLFPSPAIAAI